MNFYQSHDVDSANPRCTDIGNNKLANTWKDIVAQYHERNASLEFRQAELSERLQSMECALPTIPTSAMVAMHYGSQRPKINFESVISKSAAQFASGSFDSGETRAGDFRIEVVYERTVDPLDNERTPKVTSFGQTFFVTGDVEQRDNASTERVVSESHLSYDELVGLVRNQELAEERLLKRYISDLKSCEQKFCDTFDKTNRLLKDPPESMDFQCISFHLGKEAKEHLSQDPAMRRLQKLEYYNKRMITSLKNLRQEKNTLTKQTEILKVELGRTQKILDQVQDEVLVGQIVMPIIEEARRPVTSVQFVRNCATLTNEEGLFDESTSPKALKHLAEQFEDILEKAKNHGLSKLSGSLQDAATKLKQLSKSHEDGSYASCYCERFDSDKLGKTGDWFCDSCGGECVCDLISLNEGSSEISRSNVKGCECGCQDDKLNCECGCSTSNITQVSEAGDIFKTVECLCRCDISSDANDEIVNNSCPCGCAEIVGLSRSERDLGCDCECARGREMHYKYCCCVDSIQETFPIVEKSLRETETENLTKILERHADRIGKKNNALQQLVAQYTALGFPGVVEDFHFATAFCPHHDPTPIRPTLSGLQATIGLLRAKNQTKDEIIATLADNLIDQGVDTGKVVQNLATSNSANAYRDFDRCRLYSYLNGLAIHEQTKNEVSHVRTEAENDSSMPDLRDIAHPEMPWSRIFLPSPQNFRVVKQICNDCLLVAWTPPKDTSALNGYEILVNGYPAIRVGSPVRSEAILVSLDTSRPLLLALYSLGCGGISSRPLRLTYAPCFCIDN